MLDRFQGRSIIGKRKSSLALPENTVFLARSTALVSVRGSSDFQPLWLSRTRYNIKEFSSAVGGGSDKEKERTVVLGKSGRMVIFPLPDVQNHASPRPPSPCNSLLPS